MWTPGLINEWNSLIMFSPSVVKIEISVILFLGWPVVSTSIMEYNIYDNVSFLKLIMLACGINNV